jgi:uncharacterized protein (DUF1501 family)
VNVALPLLQRTPMYPINLPGQVFGLHPAFMNPTPADDHVARVGPSYATNGNPSLWSLFNTGKLAVVANAGTLVEPLTRAEYRAGTKRRPGQLFSHSDQQLQEQTSISEPSFLTAPTGWGGRIADRTRALNAPTATPMSMSFSGSQAFGNGVSVRTLALPTSGNFGFTGDPVGTATPTALQAARAAARADAILAAETNEMIAAAQVSMSSALNASQKLNSIINPANPDPLAAALAPFAGLNTGLANQLRAVARVIAGRSTLGHNRQVFFVSIGGFDTHSGQNQAQTLPLQIAGVNSLYQQIGYALSAFYQATANLGVANGVTTFTLSDFNRTFKPNGQGTDHAWGGHHLVMGGSVNGGRMFGQYPNLALGGPDDGDSLGRWIPTTSIEQYGATLARWFGVPDVDLTQVFPNLNRFPTANLGFMA